jgi:hypothetical protein
MNSYSLQMWVSSNLDHSLATIGFGLIAAGSLAAIVLAVTWSTVRFVDTDE